MQIVSSYGVEIKKKNIPLRSTLDIFRKAVSYLIPVYAEIWEELSEIKNLQKRFNEAEHLVHETKKNHARFPFDRHFPKMPSYLRRAAIQHALGAVSSYQSRLSLWEKGELRGKPKLVCENHAMPGFYRDDGGQWTMAFYQKTAGILIPAIGFDGMLQGFQIKLDIPLKNKDDPPEKPGAKYIWFSSSSKKGGTGSGSPVHLAGNPSARVVYVIEGLLKADISHCLTGRTFAAIAGANNTSPLDAMFALLAQSGTEEIIEAHDMDKYNNKMTMAGASKIYLMAQKHGMNCRRLTWNPNYKGFDDWQLALRQGSQRQKEIEKLSFKEQYLRGLCKLAHIEDCVEQWQHRAEQDIGLTEYLGLTGEEHKTFLCGGRDALAALLELQRRKQRFVLYQLQLDEENAIPFAFKDITALKAAGYEQPPAAMYYVAGSGEIYCPAEESDDTLLKRLFADCRERLPEGCRGRPMAISDVVELNHGAKRAYYYVSGQDQFRQVKFSPMLAKKEIPEKTQERF